YPAPEVEQSILKRVAPALPHDLIDKMITVAARVRHVFMGDESNDGELSVTMSTRTLVRWAKLTLQNQGAQSPVMLALNSALLARAPKSDAQAIERIAKDVFGLA